MITFDTKRMKMVAEKLSVVNGKIEENKDNTNVPLWELKPNTGKCFNFYDKNNPTKLICHIGFRHDRKPMEISYGTEPLYQKQGYMQEALAAFIQWYFKNTSYSELHALISNMSNIKINGKQTCTDDRDTSKHILESNGFIESELCSNAIWYTLKKA